MTNLTVIIDEKLKQCAKEKAHKEGLSLSALITQLLKSIIAGNIELQAVSCFMRNTEQNSRNTEQNSRNTEQNSRNTEQLPQVFDKLLNKAGLSEISSYERLALQRISESTVDINTLCNDFGWSVSHASVVVINLQLKGLIQKKGFYFELC